MVNQIKKNSKDIQAFLNDFETANFFQTKEPGPDGSLLQCKVIIYFEIFVIVKNLLHEYLSFSGIFRTYREKETQRFD
jgi:hypothetical protein